MNRQEQVTISKILIKHCLLGHDGILYGIIEDLEKQYPREPEHSWNKCVRDHYKEAKYEMFGVVEDEDEIRYYIGHGYSLCNYEPGELSIFYPQGGGIRKYIVGELAEKYGKLYDSWNYEVYAKRALAENK